MKNTGESFQFQVVNVIKSHIERYRLQHSTADMLRRGSRAVAAPPFFQGSSMTYVANGNHSDDAESRRPTLSTHNDPRLPPSYETVLAEEKLANGYGQFLSPNNNHHFADLSLDSNGECPRYRAGNGYCSFDSETSNCQRYLVQSAAPSTIAPAKPLRRHLQQQAPDKCPPQEMSPLVNGDLSEHDEFKNVI
jgi:hypothetical protein